MAPIHDQLLQPRLTFRLPLRRYSSRSSPEDLLDFYLPVYRRGFFLKDTFFEYAHALLDDAIREILKRWGETDLIMDRWDNMNIYRTNSLTRYRRLRTQHRKENQAVTVTTDNTSHKIVIDVHDYTGGEVKVKVVGERDVVVEGYTCTNSGDVSVSSQSFSRRFSLPSLIDIEATTSALSSDGILTIVAPKIMSRMKEEGSQVPPRVRGIVNTSAAQTHSSKWTAEATSDNCVSDTNWWKLQDKRERECDLERRQEKRPITSDFKSIYCDKGDEDSTQCGTTSLNKCSVLPIPKKGLFFSDPFFKDSWQDFSDAVRAILSSRSVLSSSTDDLARYRSLRSYDTSEETQAVKSSEDDFNHKFVIDVHDFTNGGEITVKLKGERELVVEGHMKKENGLESPKQFSRRFLLPPDVRTESVTAVMSSDGVLTITAPKKSSERRLKAKDVPINNEKVEELESLSQSSDPDLRMGGETQARELSPAVSIRTDDSCDSLAGTLWTFSVADGSPVYEESLSERSSPFESSDDETITSE